MIEYTSTTTDHLLHVRGTLTKYTRIKHSSKIRYTLIQHLTYRKGTSSENLANIRGTLSNIEYIKQTYKTSIENTKHLRGTDTFTDHVSNSRGPIANHLSKYEVRLQNYFFKITSCTEQ